MKKAFGIMALSAMVLIGCGAEENPPPQKEESKQVKKEEKVDVPKYKIAEERLDDSGMWYLTLETDSTNKKELKTLVEHTKEMAKKKDKEVSSIFVNVLKKDSPSKAYIASGRIALNSTGEAQTGLKPKEVDYEYKYKKEDHAPLPEGQNKIGANKVLKAFESAGLAVPEARDNSQNCGDLKCVKLVTTEAVSIYEWPDEAAAKNAFSKGLGDYQKGHIVIRFNESHNEDGSVKYKPEPSEEAYKEQLDKLLP